MSALRRRRVSRVIRRTRPTPQDHAAAWGITLAGEHYAASIFRQLLPEPAELPDGAAVVEGLRFEELASDARPYLVLNMVTTADGRVTLGGRSGPIGNAADQDLFHALRTRVDAVMVGAGTLRVENYGRLVRKPERREARVRAGLAPDPLAVVVSGRLDLPDDLPLLHDPEQEVLIATFSDHELPGAARIEYLRSDGGVVDVAGLLSELRRRGVRSVLCEGGPTLNAELLRAGGVDELFHCLAPKLAGEPDAPTMVSGVLHETVGMELLWLLENEHHLFMRYRLK